MSSGIKVRHSAPNAMYFSDGSVLEVEAEQDGLVSVMIHQNLQLIYRWAYPNINIISKHTTSQNVAEYLREAAAYASKQNTYTDYTWEPFLWAESLVYSLDMALVVGNEVHCFCVMMSFFAHLAQEYAWKTNKTKVLETKQNIVRLETPLPMGTVARGDDSSHEISVQEVIELRDVWVLPANETQYWMIAVGASKTANAIIYQSLYTYRIL